MNKNELQSPKKEKRKQSYEAKNAEFSHGITLIITLIIGLLLFGNLLNYNTTHLMHSVHICMNFSPVEAKSYLNCTSDPA